VNRASSAVREATPAALAVVALAFLFNFLGRGIADAFAAFILPLELEYGWSRQSTTGVFATYMLTAGLAAPASGMLFDRFGPRAVYSVGLALLGGGAYLSGEITALWQLYATAGLMIGAGVAALGMVSAAALIGRWYARNLATAIAFAYAGFGCGILITLPLVQYLIEIVGWRQAWRMTGLFTLALMLPCLMLPWGRLSGKHRRFAQGSERAGVAAGWTLGRAMRTAPYWRLVQVFFFTAVAIYSVSPQAVAFLIESGFTPISAASAFGFAGLLSTGGIIGSGWLADRIGFARTALLSFTLTGTGVLGLLALSWSSSSVAALLAYVLCFGVAQGARGPIVSTLSNRFFAGGSAATIYGTIFCGMAVGGAFGSFVGGYLHDLFNDYRPVFLFSFAGVLLAAEPFRPGTVLAAGAARPDSAD
jgi:MFS family permease